MASRAFKFRLQPVLNQREAVEQERQLRMAEIERERVAAEMRLRGFQLAIASSKQDIRRELGAGGAASKGAGVSLAAVRLQANASLHLHAKAQHAVLELAGVHRRLETARAELLAAATARKAVDLLKQRQHEQWRTEQVRKGQAEIDEINMIRAARTALLGAGV